MLSSLCASLYLQKMKHHLLFECLLLPVYITLQKVIPNSNQFQKNLKVLEENTGSIIQNIGVGEDCESDSIFPEINIRSDKRKFIELKTTSVPLMK